LDLIEQERKDKIGKIMNSTSKKLETQNAFSALKENCLNQTNFQEATLKHEKMLMKKTLETLLQNLINKNTKSLTQ